MMKRILISCIFCFFIVFATLAAPVSLQRASEVAEIFFTAKSTSEGVLRAPSRARLVSTPIPQVSYYVFENEAGGFVIIAADDVAYPILAYSNDSKWNTDNIPANVEAWLAAYELEIRSAVDSALMPSPDVVKAWRITESTYDAAVVVAPLILTRWNQSPYYNDLCPMDNARNERTVVGCVATAMAQVLKYWEYPINGNGSHSYTHTHGVQSADFASTTYDWANMPLEVHSGSTDAQKAAVAQLMYHCGVSVEMDYGVASTGGSGAFTISSKSNTTHCAEYALREYWGYKPTLQGLQKSQYKDVDWKKMLKDELDAGRPVIYSGYGEGGHCFVCDGYNEDEYFHFNWGWGGLYDGYFRLNALEPGTGGTGSGAGKYNNDQQAIFGLEPMQSIGDDESFEDLHLVSTVAISNSEIEYKEGFSISASIKNGASSHFAGEIGLALYDASLELLTIIDAQATSIAADETINAIFTTSGSSEIAAGLYYAAIYSKTASTEWESIGGGNFRNMVQLRIGTIDDCHDQVVYECDFESELLGWTFAQADGINTGFAVGGAMKYKGEKALYISPDGGTTAGYTQDSDKGYISLAYKKVYLEAGNYTLSYIYYTNLHFEDSDRDYCKVMIIPADNNPIPFDEYKENPSYLQGKIYENSYESHLSWGTYFYPRNFTVSNSGGYYLLFMFMANDHGARTQGYVMDDLKITKERKPENFKMSYRETKKGVEYTWTDNASQYTISWRTQCSNTHTEVVTDNYYLIPFTELRDATGTWYDIHLDISYHSKCGYRTSHYEYNTIYTTEFPADTCIVRPKVKAVNTDYGVKVTWQGNSDYYELKYGYDSYGCSYTNIITNIDDSTYFIPYNPTYGLQEGSTHFFVRGICANDTSIWGETSLSVKGPDARYSDLCNAKPYELYAQNTYEGIYLTWRGNANTYEIECRSEDEYYRRGNKYLNNDTNYVRFVANGSSYTIPFDVLPDTLYHFRVRSICDNDTSYWTDYISAYNINFGEYCIPFYDLCGPNTVCTHGGYNSPYSNKQTLDFRQKDWDKSYYRGYKYQDGRRYGIYGDYYDYRSRHTICFEGETDPHCDNLLSTVPPGEKYSMRLGNWHNGEGESVTYTHTIDSGYKLVLLLKYAVVLQDPSHTPQENPHFTLEILDENNNLLDPVCWYADFAADKNAEGWHNAVNAHEPTNGEYRNIVWKDWTTIGVNLSDLSIDGDRTIKIRLTTKDCTRGQHFGYAYFTLSCTTGDMRGMSCGVRPERFEVAEGFKYNWYLMDDATKTQVCDSNVFIVQPTDTNSYRVDLISLENEDCYFTLNAYTLPRLPRPQATLEHTVHDCTNEVRIKNTSYVYKIMLDKSEQPDGRIVIDSMQWDFGEYGTSTELEPKLIIPNEGDTFNISLRVVANRCADIAEYTLSIPAIRDTTTYAHQYLCKGDTLMYQEKQYFEAGVYIDSLKRTYGCDSVNILTIEYLEPEYKYYYDTICVVEAPYTFFGQSYTKTGIYEKHIPSSLGCDTIIHQLHLLVLDSLEISIADDIEFSRECGEFVLPVVVNQGTILGYSIDFSDDANANGFMDMVNDTAYSDIRFAVPPSCDAKKYHASILFHNGDCPALELPFEFMVTLYSKPESKAEFIPAPHDCINEVRIINQSAVYTYYNDSLTILADDKTVDSYYWDLGPYGESADAEPELIVPQVGDTFNISLTTTYGEYTHTAAYTLEIPSILKRDGYIYRYICQGDKFTYQGKEYSEPGQYVLDEVTNSIGCDSISYLVVDYISFEVVDLYDSICKQSLPHDFYGQACLQTGIYEHTVIAAGGCDSVRYRLNLHVIEDLQVEINAFPDICSGDASFDISYTTLSGSTTGYMVKFSEEAKTAGFADTSGVAPNSIFSIRLPEDIVPNIYRAEVLFDNHGCEFITVPLSIPILYSSDVITQRWNDLLAVRKTAYTYYEGFDAYQWYSNGVAIHGANQPTYYQPTGLEGQLYQVELTRINDGVKMLSCSYTPTLQPNTTTLVVKPSIAPRTSPVVVISTKDGVISIYNQMGMQIDTQVIDSGENSLETPSTSGVYFIELVEDSGQRHVQKIIVY